VSAEGDPAFPWLRDDPLAIQSRYAWLREHAPVSRVRLASGQQVWLIVGHDEFRAALTDARVSADHAHPGYPTLFPIVRHDTAGPRTYSAMDRGEHGPHRRRVDADFGERQVARRRKQLEALVTSYVGRLRKLTPPVDLVTELAEPVAASVIADYLGIPERSRHQLDKLARILTADPASTPNPSAASADFRAVIDDLIAASERDPADDFIGRLLSRYRWDGAYDHAQLVELIGGLVIAGQQTTSHAIALVVLALLRHRAIWNAVVEDAAVAPRAVDELLRFVSVADAVTMRVALDDLTLDGTTIPAGEGMIVSGAGADHDPRVFDHPERVDITRDLSRSVAFGYGIHKCIGQNLARAELVAVVTSLARILPGLRLELSETAWPLSPGSPINGVRALWSTW